MKASTLFGVPTMDPARHYPELGPLRKALLSRDWPTVTRFFAELPAEHDPSVAVRMVSKLKGVEDFLQTAGGGPASSTLAATLLGARWVVMGWEIRSARRATHVKPEQFAQFHDHLGRADELLDQVTTEEPDNIAAWTERIRIARGLQVGLTEARRRYDHAVKARPHPYEAQLNLLQQLCPKWGGSFELMHSFARECAELAPLGAHNAAIVAEAHIEHARTQTWEKQHMRQEHVRGDLRWAVAQSVGHVYHKPVYGWVQARSSFAYAWTLAGDPVSAAPHFAALDNRVTVSPWKWYPGTGRGTYKIRQVSALLKGGRGTSS